MSRSLSISNADLATLDAKIKSNSGARSALVNSSFFSKNRGTGNGNNTDDVGNGDTKLHTNIDIVGAIDNLKLDEEDEQVNEGDTESGSNGPHKVDANMSNPTTAGANFGFPMYPPHAQSPYYFAPYQGSLTPQQQLKGNKGPTPPTTHYSGWTNHPSDFGSQYNATNHYQGGGGYVPASEPPLSSNKRDEPNIPFVKPLELPDSKEEADAQSKKLTGLSLSQGETSTTAGSATSNEQAPNEETEGNDSGNGTEKHGQDSTGAIAPQFVNISSPPPFNPFSPMALNHHPTGPGVPPGVPSPMMPYNYPLPLPPHHPHQPPPPQQQAGGPGNFQNFGMKMGPNSPLPRPPHPSAHFNSGPTSSTGNVQSGTVWNSNENPHRAEQATGPPPHILNHLPYQTGPQQTPPIQQQQQQQQQRQQQQLHHQHAHPMHFQSGVNGNRSGPFIPNQFNRGYYNRRGNKRGGHHYGVGHFGSVINGGGNYHYRRGEDTNKYQNANIDDYRGNILSLTIDQHGCRFLQRELIKEQETKEGTERGSENGKEEQEKEVGDDSVATLVFNELHDEVINLMLDPFGNYLIQKLVECITIEQKLDLITYSKSQFNRIALDSHGTRALQKLIECVGGYKEEGKQKMCAGLIIESLAPTIVSLSKDLNGNHVVQKCLINFSNDTNQVIYDIIKDNCETIACHRHGCCVLQRCLDYGSQLQIESLSHEITQRLDKFTYDPYGNYVVQYVLTHGDESSIDTIFAYLESNFYQLSIHKFGSNVLEKSIRLNDNKRSGLLIDKLLQLSQDEFLKVLNDSFGNYVLQTCLDVAQLDQMTKLSEILVPLLPDIILTPHGKRIVNKLQ